MEEHFSCILDSRWNLFFLNLPFSWENWWSHGLVRLNAADNTNGSLVTILTFVIKASVMWFINMLYWLRGPEIHLKPNVSTKLVVKHYTTW